MKVHRIETFLKENVERDVDSLACEVCKAVISQVESTPEEIRSNLNCGRDYACCCRAFYCKDCNITYLGSAFAPNMEEYYYIEKEFS